jgi:hypothetical protein
VVSQSLRQARRRSGAAYYLEALADISVKANDLVRAARLWGAAEALLETIEAIAYPHAADRTLYDRQSAAGDSETGRGRRQPKKAGR